MSSERDLISPADLLAAIKRVLVDKESQRQVAKDFNIPPTNLQRYSDKVKRSIPDVTAATNDDLLQCLDISTTRGFPSIFSKIQEKALMDYILKCNDLYYGLSITEVKQLAFQFAKKIGVEYPEQWNDHAMAGRKWFDLFIRRHPNMSLRTPQQISLNRIRGFNRETVAAFFANYDRATDEDEYGPHSIWNMDESGFSTVPSKIGKIVSRKGSRNVGQAAAQERGTLVTMAATVNAAGTFLPPFFVFPRKKMQPYFMDHAMSGSRGVCNSSGWMQQREFVIFMDHFIKFTNASFNHPQLLLLDNHDSHLSIEAIDMAKEHGITMLTFPPHCSHRLQPLDVSVFGPLKAYYKKKCSAWSKTNANRPIEIQHIPGIVCQSIDDALTPANIKAGFKATGIWPFNSDIFSDSDFTVAEMSGENVCQHGVEIDEENDRLITFNDEPAANIEVMSEPSTSEPSTSAASLRTAVESVGPLNYKSPKKKSNRGPKSMESAILTSAEQISSLRIRAEKRKANVEKRLSKSPKKKATPAKVKPAQKKKTPANESKNVSSSSSSPSERDFCIICLEAMPAKCTKNNSIACNTCKREVHLACANIQNSYFTCIHCDSEYSEEE